MDKMSWIKDLVKAEQEMEESGMIEFTTGFKPEKQLLDETILFMTSLKRDFVDAATAFNQLKGSPMGRIKVYTVSQTQADFMLFRNGFKLIFSMVRPGTLSMKFHRSSSLNPSFSTRESEEEFLLAKWGPFGDLVWTYNNQAIKIEYLIKYYTSRFVHESTK